MKFSRILSLSITLLGTSAALKVLAKRQQWERAHRRVSICIDFDDLSAAATRAGLSLDEMLSKVAAAGATHVSLPEMTLDRLSRAGRLAPRGPQTPVAAPPPVGHWNYLFGDSDLVATIADSISKRLPQAQAKILQDGTLAFAGDLVTIGEIGLGFDLVQAEKIQNADLGVVPRPVSYAWPEKSIFEQTLAQAAQLGKWIAFDGNMIIGHEMHLDETISMMEREDLKLVYFAESRHQKGDWFVAKRRAPNIVLAHQFSPEDMIPIDFHAAAHNWAFLAKERGIRFCYINFFRVLHATAPLEGLQYIATLKKSLEADGFIVSKDPLLPGPIPTPDSSELSQIGLAAGGIAASAISQTLQLPEYLSIPLALTTAGGAAALPYLEKARAARRGGGGHHDHDHHHDDHDHDHPHEEHDHDHNHEHPHGEHDHDHGHDHHDLEILYPPSYTPKLLALAAASLGPLLTATLGRSSSPKTVWVTNLISHVGASASLAAVTSGQEYQLRIEAYRGMNLDWLLPLSGAALSLPTAPLRILGLAGLLGAWGLAYQKNLDPLAQLDMGHPQGHTHHISAAQRIIGDTVMAVGPRPARKWFGLAPFASAIGLLLRNNKQPALSTAAVFGSALGNMMGLVGFRRPERALDVTLREALPSFAIGSAAGLLLLLLDNRDN